MEDRHGGPGEVAARLRELRESSEVEAADVAAQIGEPLDAYLGYEDGSRDIPISALYKIVGALGADLAELLTGAAPKMATYCVVRDGKGLSVDRFPGYQFKSVAYNFRRRKMEPLIVSLDGEAGGDAPASRAALVTHGGQEFNYVIDGSVRLTLGKKELVLGKGDCCYFDPTIPHGQSAAGAAPARFLTVILE